MDNVPQEEKKLEERVLLIKRVSKKTTGGNYITFSALVVVGDRQGSLGLGVGRSQEVPPAIKKAIAHAKKHMIMVPLHNSTIPHKVLLKYKAARILLKPAPDGTGLKVGSVARALLEVAGIKDASGKIIGSRNQVINAHAVILALKKLRARK